MPRRLRRFISILGLILCLAAPAPALTVSAAISLREALLDIAQACRKETGLQIEFNFGGSGQLMAQIEQGAPVDLFISAAPHHLEKLRKAGLLAGAETRIVTRNTLVLIVPADAPDPPRSFADLPRVRRLAIGQPRTVPAGQYALQSLAAQNLEPMLRPRLVFGANVRQVLDYVVRGEVDAGIVYATDAALAAANVRIVATAPRDTHDPIEYPAAVIRDARHLADAQRFLDYLLQDSAQSILKKHGFLPRTPPATQPSSSHRPDAPIPPESLSSELASVPPCLRGELISQEHLP